MPRSPSRPASPRRLGPGWVPREHGAWAMLVVPVVVGALVAGPAWRHALLLVAWLAAYCAFSAAGLWLRSGRKRRYVAPLRFHALVTAALGAALLAGSPGLVLWAPAYAALLVVSLTASAWRADRSWLNDAVTVLAASLMTVVAAGLGPGWPAPALPPGADLPRAWAAAGLLAAYLLGTVPYVKTLIRDRGDRRVLAASVGYHAALAAAALVAVVVAAASGASPVRPLVLLAVAGALLARAALVPRRRPWPTPRAIGLGEVAATLVVTVATLVAVR